jgi:rod shape-determining protein MreC
MKKLNLIALLLFIVAVAGWFVVVNKERKRAFQQRVLAIISPFIHASAKVDEVVSGPADANIDPVKVREENERLTLEVQNLRFKNTELDQLRAENWELRKALEFKQRYTFNLRAAKVVKRHAHTWWNTVTIDRGSLDGVTTDSPVITESGLVGKTGKLSAHMAEVILLTDDRCRVSAVVEGTRYRGIIAGEPAGLELRPDLVLRYLDRNAAISVGSKVYSSGDGGVFPDGIMLGTVKRFENKELSGEAVVEPEVDFSILRHVFVVEMEEQIKSAENVTPAPAKQP